MFPGFSGFSGLGAPRADTSTGPKLTVDQKGKFEGSRSNLSIVLSDGKFGIKIGMDEFKGVETISTDSVTWRPVVDTDYHNTMMKLERAGFKSLQKEVVRDTFSAVADANRFDSAQQWLDSLQWDGVSRINSFLVNAFGAEDNAYHTAVSRYLWSGLAGRTIKPGEKCDMMLIAVSRQGGAKTSAIRNISPEEEFVGTMSLDTPVNDRYRAMRGKFLMELGEMTGFSKRDANELKMFLSETVDEFVDKFKTKPTRQPRRCMFFGTSNNQELLTDPTGNRRYLPFLAAVLHECDPTWVKTNRDQLWAEAAVLYKASGIQYAEAEQLGALEHENFINPDPWAGKIEAWFQTAGFDNTTPEQRPYITTNQVMVEALALRAGEMGTGAQMRVGQILRSLGWNSKKIRVGDKTLRGYVRSEQQ
jgi:predicted P-loop ATPase